MQTKKTAPPGISNNTKQQLRPINAIQEVITKYHDCACALACQKQRSISFWLEFSFVSFLCFKTKKRKDISIDPNISIAGEEKEHYRQRGQTNYHDPVFLILFIGLKRKEEHSRHRRKLIDLSFYAYKFILYKNEYSILAAH